MNRDPRLLYGADIRKCILDEVAADIARLATRRKVGRLVSVGIGEVTISQLTRKHVPIAVAAATSVLVVIVTIVFASTALVAQLIKSGGWTAVPWNLLVYDIAGVLIGGQIGPRLQGRISHTTMRRAIALLFVVLAVAMMLVAVRKLG